MALTTANPKKRINAPFTEASPLPTVAEVNKPQPIPEPPAPAVNPITAERPIPTADPALLGQAIKKNTTPLNIQNTASGLSATPDVQPQVPQKPQAPKIPTSFSPKITFNADNTVDYQVGDQNFRLTRDEYNAVLGKGGTTITPNVEALLAAQNTARETAQVAKGVQDKQRIQAIIDEIFAQQGQAQRDQSIAANQDLLNQIGNAPQNFQDPLANQNPAFEGATSIGSGLVAGGVAAATSGPLAPITAPLAFATVAFGKMSLSAHQDVKNANKLFTSSVRNMNSIVNALESGADPSAAIAAYNIQKQNIETAKSHLKLSNQNLDKYLSGGFDEMVNLENWQQVQIPLIEKAIADAVIKRDPSRVHDFSAGLDLPTQ